MLHRFLSSLFLSVAVFFSALAVDKADLFIFSYDRPLQLDAFLQSFEKYVTNVGHVVVIYRTSSDDFNKAYQQCFDDHKLLNLVVHKQGANPAQDFKYYVHRSILDSPNDYILFAVDDDIIQDFINLDECIQYLKKTNAHGFFLRLGENITECYMEHVKTPVPSHELLDDKVLKWKFSDGAGDWGYPNNVDMTIYKKMDAYSVIGNAHFTSPNTLEAAWAIHHEDRYKYGLCYQHSKMINVPFNKVMEDWEGNRYMGHSKHDFLDLYTKGNRMDIEKYAQAKNRAPHVELPVYLKMSQQPKEL